MIKIVTDSVTSIPKDLLHGEPIDIVSLYVHHEGKEYVDAEMDTEAFYVDIYDMVDNIPTSSQPSQQLVENMFSSIAKAGDQLLGIFMSSGLSGTFEGMVQAARNVGERIPSFEYTLIDSRSCGFDEAFPVFDAVEAQKAGKKMRECVAATLKGIKSTRFLFTPETLTFLQKGGRIGNAAAMLGNLVKLAPVLTVVNGEATQLAKARSRKKALELMVNEFRKDVDLYGLKRVVVHYIGSKAPAIEWAKDVIEPLLGSEVRVESVSPVIGMHVGPAVGIVYECEKVMPYKFPQGEPSLVFER